MVLKRMKQFISSVLLCSLLFSFGGFSFSKDVYAQTYQLDESLAAMSDQEQNDYIINYIQTNLDAGKSEFEIQTALAQMGVELGEISTSYYTSKGRSASSTKSKISTSIAKVTGDTTYRIYTWLYFNEKESLPSSVDLLSIEWDPTVASYSKTDCNTYASYMDGSNRSNGIVLFNVDDAAYTVQSIASATVYVVPKKSADLSTYSYLVHTYDSASFSWTIGGNVSYSSTGPAGGASFSISNNLTASSWQIAADATAAVSK